MECPKCGEINEAGADTCAFCGIVFARYQQQRLRSKPQPDPPRSIGPMGLNNLKIWSLYFTRLARLLRAGTPLPNALQEAVGGAATETAAEKAARHVESGSGLVNAFARTGQVWPAFLWAHLEAGEASGNLPEMIEKVANELADRRKRVLGRLFNGRTIWFFLMVVGAVGSLAVSGSTGSISEEIVNEGSGAVLSTILSGTMWRVFVYGGAATVFLWVFFWFQMIGKHQLTQRYPAFERLRLKLPLFSEILITDAMIRYLDLLGAMISAGLPLPRSLELARADIDLPEWRDAFEEARNTISAGGTISQGLAKVPHVPKDLISEITVGERTGELAEGMHTYAQSMREKLARLHTTANILFGIGLFIIGAILTVMVFMRGLTSLTNMIERVLG